MRLVAVPLSADQVTRFYEGFSNGVLWPLFHYLLDQIPLQVSDWDGYVEANERFADVVAAHYRPGDLIWVHDYQLFLLPGLLRDRLPGARIGFFLHIPFPVRGAVPHAALRATGSCRACSGADLVGFHTPAYLRHFATSLTDILGYSVEIDRVQLPGREVRLGVFPMGVDAAAFAALADDPAVDGEVARHPGRRQRPDPRGRRPAGLHQGHSRAGCSPTSACCETHPDLREKVRLVQVAVPSRTNVGAYQDFRALVDGLVGPDQRRVRHAALGAGALHLPRAVRARPGRALPRRRRDAGDAAARRDEPGGQGVRRLADRRRRRAGAERVRRRGVGAARGAAGQPVRRRRLGGAVLPRAHDAARGAPRAAGAAPDPGAHVRRASLGGLVPRAPGRDRRPAEARARPPRPAARRPGASWPAGWRRPTRCSSCSTTTARWCRSRRRPSWRGPTPTLLDLLRALAARPDTEVHLVSGRPQDTLEEWLGDLPIWLHAEHGFVSRDPATREWVPAAEFGGSWREPVLAMLREITAADARARWSRSRRRPSRGTTAWPTRRPAPAAPTSSGCI